MTPVTAPLITTERTRLRALQADDGVTVRALRASPAVAQWWHPVDDAWPFDNDDDTTSWVVELNGATALGPDGAMVGYVQAYEGEDPDYDEAGIDLFLAASVHRQGLGREVVTAVRDWLVEDRGHHVVTIDPAAHNEAAIRCYRACGFQPVGVIPLRERDTSGPGWHDTLLLAYTPG